MSYLN